MDLKTWLSPIPMNQEPPQIDKTEFWQKLISESTRQPVLVGYHSACLIFFKNTVWMRPKTILWLFYLKYGYSNPLQTLIQIEGSLLRWTDYPVKLTEVRLDKIYCSGCSLGSCRYPNAPSFHLIAHTFLIFS